MLKILSASNIVLLEAEANKYDIESMGSLSISNGHYFLAFLGKLKEEPKIESKPAPAKRKPRKKPQPKVTDK